MASGPTQMTHARAQESWNAHPAVSACLRTFILVMPIIVSVLLGIWASSNIPPDVLRVNPWLWWIGLMIVATIAVRFLDLGLRRLSPLAMLFRLSLVFPDQTPSRFSAALRAGTITGTKKRIREIQERGGTLTGDDAVSAQMLELIALLSKHDRMTRGHAERVRGYSELIAKEMGITGGSFERLRWAALLHDMGKLDVPPEILNKDGRPTDEEWAILARHPEKAERYLAPIADWLGEWRHAADGHHERWDGTGYPRGLAGTDIPLAARIVAVADAYDVMTSTRSYKKPMPAEVARREISDNAGTQFDPTVARAFLALGLGDLRRVGGPVAWFASLPAIRQVPIGSVTQPIATGIVATATTMSAAVVNLPEEPPRQPPAIAFADETTTTLPPPETTVITTTAAPTTAPPAPSPTTTTTTTTSPPPPPENIPPLMPVQVLSVAETASSGPTGAFVEATDSDGPGGIAFAVVGGAHPFDIDSGSGELRLLDGAALDAETAGSYLVVVTASDGEATTTTLHTVMVTAVDEAPAVAARTAIVPENAPIGETVVLVPATDPEGEPLTWTILDTSAPFAIDATGRITVNGTLDFETRSTHTLPVRVTDPAGNSATAQIEVLIANVDEPPSDATLFQTVEEGGTIVIDIDAAHRDPEGRVVTIRAVVDDGTSGATTIVGDTRLSYVHDGSETTADIVRYDVVDESGLVGSGTIELTITPQNDPPEMLAQTFAVSEDSAAGPTGRVIVATDPDGPDPLSFTLVTAGTPFTMSPDGEIVVADPAALDHEAVSTYTLVVEVTDGVDTATATHTLELTDVNEPPATADTTMDVDESATVGTAVGTVAATDPEAGTLTWELLPTTAPLSISANTGAITVTGPLDHETDSGYTVRVRITDPEGSEAFADVDVIVNDVNEPPNDATITLTVDEGASGQILIFGVHVDPETTPVTVFSIDSVSNGSAFIADPDRIQFDHDGSETTTARVEYTVADGHGYQGSGIAEITVTPVNDPPTMAAQTFTLSEDTVPGPTGRFVVASDVDGPDPLTFTLLTGGTPFSLSSTGQLVLDDDGDDDEDELDHEDDPSWTLLVRVDDGEDVTTASMTVNITDVNEAPGAPEQFHQAPETESNGFLVGTFEAVDPEGDPITISIAPGTNINPDGDGFDAYSATITGTTVRVFINDADDVDHGVSGQAVTLGIVLEDDNGNSSTVDVNIATQTRFGLSEHFGEVVITEVDWSSPGAEFIEIINISGDGVDMAGWTISDYAHGIDPADAQSFVFTIPADVTDYDNGQRIVFWTHLQVDPQQAGIEYYLNQDPQNLVGSDDVWLLDENGRIVAYVAWGTDTIQDADNEIGDRPPIVSWNLWDVAYEANLGTGPDVTSGQSIALALENASSAVDSACWEPNASGDAAPRCAGANLTINRDPGADDNPNRNSSPGRPNY